MTAKVSLSPDIQIGMHLGGRLIVILYPPRYNNWSNWASDISRANQSLYGMEVCYRQKNQITT